jgi:hypothetical protein
MLETVWFSRRGKILQQINTKAYQTEQRQRMRIEYAGRIEQEMRAENRLNVEHRVR